jgi:cytoskeletal protein CcmA (bactofilin family)
MWKKSDEDSPTTSLPASHPSPAPRPAAEPRRGGSSATIGESIRVQGEIHGDEDLVIEGEVDGSVHLDKHSVTVGRSGRVKADIHGGTLVVEGKVQGNLFAGEQVVVRSSGEVRGNITSPRVSLEDGSKFKGSIDMEPRGGGRVAETKADERRGPASKPNGSPSGASASGGPGAPAGAGGTGGKEPAAQRSGAGTP